MTRAANFAILALLGLAACDNGTRPESLVVYISHDAAAELVTSFSRFTKETGIPVATAVGDSGTNTQKVIDNSGSPPADILLTSNIADILLAAEEGALRPIVARAMDAVPDMLRDSDGFWAAISVRQAQIGVAPQAESVSIDDYGDLGRVDMHGKVCLSSSVLSVNRSLIAMLIEDLGMKPAERIVRGWVKNLAAAPFASEPELVGALRAGTCHYGIISSAAESDGVRRIVPAPAYVDVDGIGVARHTGRADAANQLVEWLLMDAALQQPNSSNGKNVGLAGYWDGEARSLAERVAYR